MERSSWMGWPSTSRHKETVDCIEGAITTSVRTQDSKIYLLTWQDCTSGWATWLLRCQPKGVCLLCVLEDTLQWCKCGYSVSLCHYSCSNKDIHCTKIRVERHVLAKAVSFVTTHIRIKDINIVAWTDSKVALLWVRTTPGKLKLYVANRVSAWGYHPRQVEICFFKTQPPQMWHLEVFAGRAAYCKFWWEGPLGWSLHPICGLKKRTLNQWLPYQNWDHLTLSFPIPLKSGWRPVGFSEFF